MLEISVPCWTSLGPLSVQMQSQRDFDRFARSPSGSDDDDAPGRGLGGDECRVIGRQGVIANVAQHERKVRERARRRE